MIKIQITCIWYCVFKALESKILFHNLFKKRLNSLVAAKNYMTFHKYNVSEILSTTQILNNFGYTAVLTILILYI